MESRKTLLRSRGRLFLAALLIIFALGLVIRLTALDAVPPEPFMDETSVACESWSLALTGHDTYGVRWPIMFRALGDWKHPLYLYAASITTGLLGPTTTAVRLPAALLGSLTILVLALLAGETDPRRPRIAAFAALVLALMPWHIQYSRMAWEAVVMLLAFTLAAWLWLRAARLGGVARFALAGAALGLCVYTYTPSKLLAPCFLLLEISLSFAGRERRARAAEVAALVAAAALVAFPMAWVQLVHRDEINQRFLTFSVGREPEPVGAAIRSYGSHLSPVFLFWSGDARPRHAMPGFGECLLVTAPLCVIALVQAGARRERADLLLLGWLLIFPLGGALTTDGVPHASRASLACPLLALLAARGASIAAERIGRRRVAWAALALVVAANGAWFLRAYARDYAALSATDWSAGKGAMIRGAARLVSEGKAKRVVLPGFAVAREDVLFHAGFDPRRLAEQWPDPRWTWTDRKRDPGPLLRTMATDELLLWPTGEMDDPTIVPELLPDLPWRGTFPALYRGLRRN